MICASASSSGPSGSGSCSIGVSAPDGTSSTGSPTVLAKSGSALTSSSVDTSAKICGG